jgi:hypothetical protein
VQVLLDMPFRNEIDVMSSFARPINVIRLSIALTCVSTIGCDSDAQFAQVNLSLDATCGSPFGYIGGVRELQDQRVIVADPLGVALVIADLNANSIDTIGHIGAGPEEYRQPDRVLPLPGDSTLLVDLGNSRLTVLDPDDRFLEHYPIARQTASGANALIVPRFTDGLGRLYFLAEGVGGRRSSSNSTGPVRGERRLGCLCRWLGRYRFR